MTAPFRDAQGYVHMPGGYDPSRAQQGLPPAAAPVAQPQAPAPAPMPQTPLGVGALPFQQAAPFVPQQDGTPSPLSQVAPRTPWQQNAPAPVVPNNQFPAPAQPVPQPQYQVQPAPVLAQPLSGPGVPPELQGKTIAEVIGIANGLRAAFLNMPQNQPQNQNAPAQNNQPSAQQQNGTQPAPFDWRNPRDAFGAIVDEKLGKFEQRVGQVLAPVIQQGQMQGALVARNQAAQQIPNYAQIEPLVIQKLQGMDPNTLQNPQTWIMAANIVNGEQMANQVRTQQTGAPAVGFAPPGQPGFQPQYTQGNPAPNMNAFGGFTEQPNAGGPYTATMAPLDPFTDGIRQAMGMDMQTYTAWRAGVPVNGARR